jgi:hypothetical protein
MRLAEAAAGGNRSSLALRKLKKVTFAKVIVGITMLTNVVPDLLARNKSNAFVSDFNKRKGNETKKEKEISRIALEFLIKTIPALV